MALDLKNRDRIGVYDPEHHSATGSKPATPAGAAAHRRFPGRDEAGNASPWRALYRHFEEVEAPCLDTLDDIAVEMGTDLAKLARRLDIGADVLAASVRGVVPGLPKPRLVRSLAYELGVSYDAVAQAIMSAASAVSDGSEGRPRAESPPCPPRPYRPPTGTGGTSRTEHRTFVELVERSSMSSEQKSYWLGDD